MRLYFNDFEIEITDDRDYKLNSSDNEFNYDFVYNDEAANDYQSCNHAIKIYNKGQLLKSAIICAVGGGTSVDTNSAVIDQNDLFVCCADKVFSLNLPELTLNWATQADQATCFGIYKIDNGLITHGEMEVARLNKDGKILWQKGLRDIIVNMDGKDSFILHENYIALIDFNSNKYKIDFNGNFIEDELSELQNDMINSIEKG